MTTKEAYRKKLETLQRESAARFDRLKAKARKATADVRIKYLDEMESLGTSRTVIRNMLEEVGKRGLSAWGDVRNEGGKIWGKVSRVMEKAVAHFK